MKVHLAMTQQVLNLLLIPLRLNYMHSWSSLFNFVTRVLKNKPYLYSLPQSYNKTAETC